MALMHFFIGEQMSQRPLLDGIWKTAWCGVDCGHAMRQLRFIFKIALSPQTTGRDITQPLTGRNQRINGQLPLLPGGTVAFTASETLRCIR